MGSIIDEQFKVAILIAFLERLRLYDGVIASVNTRPDQMTTWNHVSMISLKTINGLSRLKISDLRL